jgi:hypothetical protein
MKLLIHFRLVWPGLRELLPIGFVLQYSSEGENKTPLTFRGRKNIEAVC